MRINNITYVNRRRRKGKRIFIYVLILILIAAVAITLIFGLSGWGLVHPPKKPVESYSGSNKEKGYPPVLFIYSKDDKSIPLENSAKLYAAYSSTPGNKSEIWITDGAGHAESYTKSPDMYMEKVFSFLDKVFAVQ